MTLYVLGAAPVQQLYRPIYTALLAWLLHEAEDYADASPDGRLPVPLLLAIDEAGTTAPLPDLARITATVRKAGIRLVTAWHDLSQLEARYGTRRGRHHPQRRRLGAGPSRADRPANHRLGRARLRPTRGRRREHLPEHHQVPRSR